MASLVLHGPRISPVSLQPSLGFAVDISKTLQCRVGRPVGLASACAARAEVLGIKSSNRECGGRQRHSAQVRAASMELSPPPIDSDLHEIMRDMGAEFSEEGVVETFGNDDEAIEGAENGVAVIEMSHFGRLRVTGDDRLHFLHNQSTADFKSIREGQGCYTVFTTPTARTIDLAAAWVMGTSVILLVSPNTRKSIYDRLNKYIFFADKVEVEDITDKTHFFSITGPSSDDLLRKLELESVIGKPIGTHIHYAVEGTPITVGVGSGLAGKGYTLMLSTSTAGIVWEALVKAGAVPMGSVAWERLRILQGRPAAGSELTDEFNVLEAGLWRTISLTKGCYIGQETIAKLVTYGGVKQALWGIELNGAAAPGALITVDGQKVGQLTSCTVGRDRSKYFGLGYIRRKAGDAGLQVDVDGIAGLLVDVPFVTRSLSATRELALLCHGDKVFIQKLRHWYHAEKGQGLQAFSLISLQPFNMFSDTPRESGLLFWRSGPEH